LSERQLRPLIILYLTLGPINWIPGIPPSLVNLFKYFVFAIILLASVTRKNVRFVKPLTVNYFLVTMVCCLPAIINGTGNMIFNIVDFMMIFFVSMVVGTLKYSLDDWFEILWAHRVYCGPSSFVGSTLLYDVKKKVSVMGLSWCNGTYNSIEDDLRFFEEAREFCPNLEILS
jgi:hypothetical protein